MIQEADKIKENEKKETELWREKAENILFLLITERLVSQFNIEFTKLSLDQRSLILSTIHESLVNCQIFSNRKNYAKILGINTSVLSRMALAMLESGHFRVLRGSYVIFANNRVTFVHELSHFVDHLIFYDIKGFLSSEINANNVKQMRMEVFRTNERRKLIQLREKISILGSLTSFTSALLTWEKIHLSHGSDSEYFFYCLVAGAIYSVSYIANSWNYSNIDGEKLARVAQKRTREFF